MAWTPKQLEAIELRDNNILVAAAAGSGKTAVLVERVKQLILSGEAQIDEILVVTFTNAAAAEMKEKIVSAIRGQIEQNPSESRFLKKQLNLIQKSNISTFHAFALEVIRNYFHVIGIDPGFKVCDEAQSKILKGQAIDDLFEKKLNEGSEAFIHFLDCYSSTKSFDSLKEQLLTCYENIRSVPDSLEKLKEAAEGLNCSDEEFLSSKAFAMMKSDIKRLMESSEKTCEKVMELLVVNGLERLAEKLIIEKAKFAELGATLQNEGFTAFTKSLSDLKYATLSTKKEEKEQYDLIKDKVSAMREGYKNNIKKVKECYLYQSIEEFTEELRNSYPLAKTLYELICQFDLLYKEAKEEKGLIDFSDIEHYALKILENDQVAEGYKQKFKFIFVDEYQDSNIIQETMINRIARANNVFMVGDVKQSIYKFRLAEPEIFEQKYSDYKAGKIPTSKVIDLNANFRSKGNVIRTVNEQFESIMKGYDEDAALYKGVVYEGPMDHQSELHIAFTGADDIEDVEIKELKTAEMEALAAVSVIKENVGNTRIFDVKADMERSLEYKDIVILMRGVKNTAEVYKKIFAEEGIPLHAEESDGYFDTIEVEIFLNLLKCIDNKKQDIPMISILYSPIFGFNGDELAEIRLIRRERGVSFCQAFIEYAKAGQTVDNDNSTSASSETAINMELSKRCQEVLEKLNEWKDLSRLMPLADFIWKLMIDTGFYVYAGALPAGEQRQANLRALVDKAGVFAEVNSGIYGFLSYVEVLREKKIPTGQITLTGEGENAVRIMTIHKSKGLDFPMVIVAGLGKRFNKRTDSPQIVFHKDIGLGLRIVNTEQRWHKKSIIQQIIERQTLWESMEEEVRILYVAYTRTADKLVLLGTVKDYDELAEKIALKDPRDLLSASCYLDLILPVLAESHGIKEHWPKDISFHRVLNVSRKNELKKLLEQTKNIEIRESLAERLSYKYPYMEDLKLKSKYSVSELNRHEAERKLSILIPLSIDMAEEGKGSRLTAAQRGSIYHLILEHTDFANREMKSAAETLKFLVDNEFITSEEAGSIKPSIVDDFMKSDLAKRMETAAKKGKLFKEEAFTLKTQKEDKSVLVQGIIDCYFSETDETGNEQYVLLDYKTNRLMTGDEEEINTIKELYSKQIELYSEALEKMSQKVVKEKYLCLVSEGRIIDMNSKGKE